MVAPVPVAKAAAASLRYSYDAQLVGLTVAACVIQLLPWHSSLLQAPAGLWLVLVGPVIVWQQILSSVLISRDSRWLVAVGFTVLSDIVVALLCNTVLPLAGVDRPLNKVTLAVALTVSMLALLYVSQRLTRFSYHRSWQGAPPGLAPVLLLGVMCVLTAVSGAIRLNNGLSDSVSLTSLILMAVLLCVLMAKSDYGDDVTQLGIVFVGAALLLLTSMRGWFVTGHDAQLEFFVYFMAHENGHWNIGDFRDPYNSCLSVTLLPNAFSQLTGIPGAYVFKLVLPLIFAVAPALVYRSVRNFAPRLLALLSAIYFLAFPTYVNDIAFLARQEVALLLLGSAVVVLTDSGGSLSARRLAFTVLALGIPLSHYSTAFVLILVMILAKLLAVACRLLPGLRNRKQPVPASGGRSDFVTWGMIAVVTTGAWLWIGPATDTSQELTRSVTNATRTFMRAGMVGGSSDVAYSILSSERVTPAERLREFAAEATEARTSAGRPQLYEPLSAATAHPISTAAEDRLPLTGLGRSLSGMGLDVGGTQAAIRQVCAALLQILLVIGLVSTFRKRAPIRAPFDLTMLALASTAVIGLQTVMPQLTVDYGVLRSFQQGLLFFAPFIAIGSISMFSWAGSLRNPLSCVLAVFFFVELSGVLPRATGGYLPQLNLSNTGTYYANFYAHPQERNAAAWVTDQLYGGGRRPARVSFQTDAFTFARVRTVAPERFEDMYPTRVRKNSYVLLGHSTERHGKVGVSQGGDMVTYEYPREFLEGAKNKVFSNNGASVYR